MTKRERAQVVELLRCAADQRADGIGLNGMFDGAVSLRAADQTIALAWNVLISVQRGHLIRTVVGIVDEWYRAELLEAAARVEEGSWP